MKIDPTGLADITACPLTLEGCEEKPDVWTRYPRRSGEDMFHCSYTCFNENKKPTPDSPRQQCCYKPDGKLANDWCQGTADYYSCDEAIVSWNCAKHTFIDPGGILLSGIPGLIIYCCS